LRYPNLLWAIANWGPRYRFAAAQGHSESWLSRRLNGRAEFSPDERRKVALALEYPIDWLFQTPEPPLKTSANGVDVPIGDTADTFARARSEHP
jgi:hypothetical protein